MSASRCYACQQPAPNHTVGCAAVAIDNATPAAPSEPVAWITGAMLLDAEACAVPRVGEPIYDAFARELRSRRTRPAPRDRRYPCGCLIGLRGEAVSLVEVCDGHRTADEARLPAPAPREGVTEAAIAALQLIAVLPHSSDGAIEAIGTAEHILNVFSEEIAALAVSP